MSRKKASEIGGFLLLIKVISHVILLAAEI